jgi:carbon monoxide dehydrogenase subunit G
MNIEANGSYTFYFDRSTVWNILMNPEAVAHALPNVREMLPLGDELLAWKATAQLELMGKKATYTGIIRMLDIDTPNTYRLVATSEKPDIEVDMMLMLSDEVEGKTLVTWNAVIAFADDVSDNMRGVVQMMAMMLSQQFFMGLAKQLRAAERKAV